MLLGLLLPGLVVIVTLLKNRPKVLWWLLGAWFAVGVAATIWSAGADSGDGMPFWLVLVVILFWFVALGSLMVEPAEGSWWHRHRMDERFSTFFGWVGVLLLIACPLSLAIAYLLESNVGGVITMGLFAAVIAKSFLWDQLRA